MVRIARYALACAVALAATACVDRIHVKNTAKDEEFGILLDGKHSSGVIATDEVHRSLTSPLEFNNLDARPFDPARLVDQVLAFSRDRAVVSVRGRWTPEWDTRTLDLPPAVGMPIVVYRVTDSWNGNAPRALGAGADALLFDERVGARLMCGTCHVRDVVDTHAHAYDAIVQGDFDKGHPESDFRAKLGWIPGRINVYLTDRAPDPDAVGYSSETAGWTFETREHGDTVIVLGKQATGALLAHEVGHALGLHHVDYLHGTGFYDGFDKSNVMCSFGGEREYVTEGQTFRAHFSSDSCINVAYHARDGRPELEELQSIKSGTHKVPLPGADPPFDLNRSFGDYCAANRRVWKDGGWPADDAVAGTPTWNAPLPGPAVSLPEFYFEADCGVGETLDLAERLRATGLRHEAVFLGALRSGLPREQAARARARRAYARLRAYRRHFPGLWRLPPEGVFIARRLARQLTRRRTRAIEALGVLRSRRAVPELERIAADRTSALAGVAQRALERMG